MADNDIKNDIQYDEENADGRQKLKKLREELKKCRHEKEEYLAGWQRAKADFINYKKAEGARLENHTESKQAEIILDMLRIIDELESAILSFDPKKADNWLDGIKNIHTHIKTMLSSYGVREIPPDTEVFDPNLHEAVSIAETSDAVKDGKIKQIVQKGYLFKEKVIRPAKVVINRHN